MSACESIPSSGSNEKKKNPALERGIDHQTVSCGRENLLMKYSES